MSDPQDKRRRAFLLGAGGMAAAAGAWMLGEPLVAPSEGSTSPEGPEGEKAAVQGMYRVLGKTGLKISRVGVGTSTAASPAVLERCIDLGLNYIDTAYVYEGGESEKSIGRVMKHRRKDVVLTTKFPPGARTAAQMTAALDTSLKRLQTDHVDCVIVHAVDEVERITNPEVFEAFEAARKAGKVSFLGMSGHGPNLPAVLEKVASMERYDMVLIKYSFMSYPRLGPLVAKLAAKNIGITTMKTRDGARHVDLEVFQKDDGFVGAAIRWAVSDPKVASAVITTKTFRDADLYAHIARQAFTSRDRALLEHYAATFDKIQCRGCGDCGEACPSGVPVWDVDRAAMYYERYGAERRGMTLYATLGNPAQACVDCDAPCQSACDHEIPIRSQMIHAHDLLGWLPPEGRGV